MQSSRRIYFSYSQIYQISHAFPIYRRAGGTFLVRNLKQYLQFKKYTRGLKNSDDPWTLLRTPPVSIFDTRRAIRFPGVLVSSSAYDLHPANRRIKTIYTGHGSGDKPYRGRHMYERMAAFDYHFITEPKNLQKLKDKGLDLPPERLVPIGNMRFDDYVNGVFDRRREAERLGIRDTGRRNILYAPTWQWGRGSLLRLALRFGREVLHDGNLIIRPHSHDRRHLPKLKRAVKQERLTHIYFSNPSNLAADDTMADFAASDILVADETSSVCYEYLITGKPVILIPTRFEAVHQMPAALKIQSVARHWDAERPLADQIREVLEGHERNAPAYRALRERCFYHNDGCSTQRALDFITQLFEEDL